MDTLPFTGSITNLQVNGQQLLGSNWLHQQAAIKPFSQEYMLELEDQHTIPPPSPVAFTQEIARDMAKMTMAGRKIPPHYMVRHQPNMSDPYGKDVTVGAKGHANIYAFDKHDLEKEI